MSTAPPTPPAAMTTILYGSPADFVWRQEDFQDHHFPGVVFVKCTSCLTIDTGAPTGPAYMVFMALYARVDGRLVGPLQLYDDGPGQGGSPAE